MTNYLTTPSTPETISPSYGNAHYAQNTLKVVASFANLISHQIFCLFERGVVYRGRMGEEMFELCLFDLDNTLVETDDMKDLRESGKNKNDAAYIKSVKNEFLADIGRHIYSEDLIVRLRKKFPEMKIGIFTRSPRSYATTILTLAYPSVQWDAIVAYEDVARTKPHGEGVHKAMLSLGCKNTAKVVLIGDGDNDIRAAYNAGCVAVLDKTSWENRLTNDNWNALGHIPDVIISDPEKIFEVIENYKAYLPELERLLYRVDKVSSSRFDKVNKFIHRGAGGGKTAYPIFASGRSFSGYESLKLRKKWHRLTTGIHAQKDADQFPDAWIEAVRIFIRTQFPLLILLGGELIVSVIPHRPGRKPRLENFLDQLAASYLKEPLKGKGKVSFVSDLLAYKDGVRSNSNDKLGPVERFENVRDHLFVKREDVVKKGPKFLIIDDVSTTGATLIYAKKYLTEAGATEVTCFSIAMNISNVLYD
ncbi:HAD-IA family hydrolase [Mesorhizobium sp. M0030]|uniref:HAD-IA family hydrolase n=1 Tax=Mesorhizobium sp. M0030 TaxID=2956851 RepID=UPI00333ADAD8